MSFFFSFGFFVSGTRDDGTCLFMWVILHAARASIFHVNHPRVDWDRVFHKSLLQVWVNCVQRCQPAGRQDQVNRTLALLRLGQALVWVMKVNRRKESWEVKNRPHLHAPHKLLRTTPCSLRRLQSSNPRARHPQRLPCAALPDLWLPADGGQHDRLPRR